jgi:Cu-Zn family superoxide dismutase
MFGRGIKMLVMGVVVGLVGAGCASKSHDQAAVSQSEVLRAADMGADVKEAVAVVHGTKGNEKVMGVAKFTDTGAGVKVVADIEGLEPNSEHGFHVHEFGDCSDMEKAMSAGGHYNPEKHQHGKPGDPNSHVGDMGNIKADASGKAHVEMTLGAATVSGKNALLGRGVIVHAKADDFSQPVGNAGGRIGCGVIGVAQVKKP